MIRRSSLLFLAVLAVGWTQESAPVSIEGKTLWVVKAARAGYSPADRARDISESIISFAEDSRRSLSDVRDVQLDSETILLVSRAFLFSVTDEDARVEGRGRNDLYSERKSIVLAAISRYRESRSLVTLARSAALGAGAILLAVLVLVLLRRVQLQLERRLPRVLSEHSRTSGLAAWYRVFRGPLILLVRVALRLSFAVLGLVMGWGALSFALGLFPATAEWSGMGRGYLAQLVAAAVRSMVSYLPNLVVLLVVVLVTYVLIWVARAIAEAVDEGAIVIAGFHQDWAQPTYGLVRILFVLLGLVVAFPYLPGGESPALKGASIFVGVLVSLGSGSAMGNAVAGVILTYMLPFRVGDRVQIADTTGDVLEKALLVTRVRTIKNVEVIVPNSAILGAHILNYSAQAKVHGLILHTTVTLGYDAPWRTVHELMVKAALRTTGILDAPKPFVLQTSLNDSHVSYELNAYTAEANRMAELYSDLHRNLQEEFNQGGLEIMSPMYLSLRDGNMVTIPAGQRPDGYQPPAFRVKREKADLTEADG